MPKADDFFGFGQGNTKAISSELMPPGMFGDAYAMGNMNEPTAEQMEEAMKAVRYSKVIKVKEFHVKTFDLSRAEQLEDYKKEIVKLYNVMAEKRGVVSYNEKRLMMVEGVARMIVHLEWYEYALSVTDHMMKQMKAEQKAKEQADAKARRRGKKMADVPGGALGQEAEGERG